MKKEKATILIIDDDEDVLLSAQLLLKRHYEKVVKAPHPRDLNSLISTERPDLILLDMNFRLGFNNGEEGLYWLQHIKDVDPNIPVILMTAFGEIELAVEALKLGASDFILKPWENEKLHQKISKALRSQKKPKSSSTQNQAPIQTQSDSFVTGNSAAFEQVMQVVEKVSKTSANVLILGKVERENNRLPGRFMLCLIERIKCLFTSIWEPYLRIFLKVSYLDIKREPLRMLVKIKKVVLSLPLEERSSWMRLGNLPLNLQAKLLSVLQDRKFSRIGEGEERQVDARFIFATNAPLEEWVKTGKFREDLMYRINTIEIPLPPLRDRKEDIPIFLHHFLHVFSEKYEKSQLKFSREAMDTLKNYLWPGNIRELQHAIERAVILAEGGHHPTLGFQT